MIPDDDRYRTVPYACTDCQTVYSYKYTVPTVPYHFAGYSIGAQTGAREIACCSKMLCQMEFPPLLFKPQLKMHSIYLTPPARGALSKTALQAQRCPFEITIAAEIELCISLLLLL